jgi:uncharacterized protein YjbI with pentapeptide repeats
MANKKQLALLKEGVSGWNECWNGNPDVTIDLRRADLSGQDLRRADLSGADLSGADLSGADLRWARLSQADLRGAHLSGATFSKADLSEADFFGADLRRADLSKADLRGAHLSGATFSRADLTKANLSGAHLSRANLRKADLSKADLSGTTLRRALLREADLVRANLSEADLRDSYCSGAHLSGADLRRANLSDADLSKADLSGANLSGADLRRANLGETNLGDADLSKADLSGANLIGANFQRANLTDCRIYGISARDVKLEGATQKNLIITEIGKPTLIVDDMEVAQFIYLLLNNQKIKNVIDTITSKAVLILGRFTEERKAVLDSIRDELRRRGYLPILFDFEPSASRDLTETVTLLARMARFIIVDLTDPKAVPPELSSIIPDLPSVPVQPIILNSRRVYAIFEHWDEYPWVLEIQKYKGVDALLEDIPGKVIDPAEKYLLKQRPKKPQLMLKRPKQ